MLQVASELGFPPDVLKTKQYKMVIKECIVRAKEEKSARAFVARSAAFESPPKAEAPTVPAGFSFESPQAKADATPHEKMYSRTKQGRGILQNRRVDPQQLRNLLFHIDLRSLQCQKADQEVPPTDFHRGALLLNVHYRRNRKNLTGWTYAG